jgi:transposase
LKLFVPVKSAVQQAVLTMHRAEDFLVRQRTMLVNVLRAHVTEFGIVGAQGRQRVRDLVAIVADEKDTRVPAIARALGGSRQSDRRSAGSDREIVGRVIIWQRSSEVSQRIAGMPAVGPIIASAIVASVPDASVFRSGREFAAWLGLVPKQSGTGGKTWLGPISSGAMMNLGDDGLREAAYRGG